MTTAGTTEQGHSVNAVDLSPFRTRREHAPTPTPAYRVTALLWALSLEVCAMPRRDSVCAKGTWRAKTVTAVNLDTSD